MRLVIALVLLVASPLRAEVEITPVTSPGGLDAWLVEEHAIPFVAVDLVFEGGAALDPDDALGATALMAALLDEGAGALDAQGFAIRSEELAARISFDAGRDTVSVSAQFLTETAPEAIALLNTALTRPRFDADAVERVRGQMVASLRRDALDPNRMASRAFAENAYPGHPYARPSDGTPDSVAALTRDDLVRAHTGAIARDRVHIGVAGDIDAATLAPLLDALFKGVPETGAPLPPHATFAAEPGLTQVPFDGPQSVIAFGHRGIARDDPDFLTAFVVNEIIGGGRFGTRLMTELREKRGLTYGVGAFLASGFLGESYQGRLSASNSDVGTVMDLIRAEWAKLARDGVTAEELERIQTYLTGAYPLRFDGNGAIAGMMASMQFQGFGIDYVNTRNDMVAGVTLDDANAMAKRLYQPDALHFVVVGQPEGIN
ncbi:MAG: insulinase family protein [Alphaproteobacteria bacterium]|jgi:zinc protease|nr:insulinase family protein [Alphaproteobacteria bacterium]